MPPLELARLHLRRLLRRGWMTTAIVLAAPILLVLARGVAAPGPGSVTTRVLWFGAAALVATGIVCGLSLLEEARAGVLARQHRAGLPAASVILAHTLAGTTLGLLQTAPLLLLLLFLGDPGGRATASTLVWIAPLAATLSAGSGQALALAAGTRGRFAGLVAALCVGLAAIAIVFPRQGAGDLALAPTLLALAAGSVLAHAGATLLLDRRAPHRPPLPGGGRSATL